MKVIISCLLVILVLSSYMALTTERREIPPQISAPTIPTPSAEADLDRALNELLKATQESNKKIESYSIEIIEAEEPEDYSEDEPMDEDEFFDEEKSYADSIEQEIADVFGHEHKIALAIAKAESGLNPRAINTNRDGSRDIGIFQINDSHGWSAEDRFDPSKNIRMAKELRDRCGWGEWVVYNNRTYRNYL